MRKNKILITLGLVIVLIATLCLPMYFTSPGLQAFLSDQTAHFFPEIPDTADNSYWVCVAVMVAVVTAAVVLRKRCKE